MRHLYSLPLLLALGAVLLAPAGGAQTVEGDTMYVDWAQDNGFDVEVNALRNAILGDTTATGDRANPDRVYKLRRGGFYWVTDPITNRYTKGDGTVIDFDLHIVGATSGEAEDNVCGDSGTEDCGPAILQRTPREDGADPSPTILQLYNSSTIETVWIQGQTTTGVLANYEPIKMVGVGQRYVWDGVIFDRNDWHHLGVDNGPNTFIVRNSKFRNLIGPGQIWEGLGIRIDVPADTLIFENNTFLNIGFAPFQMEGNPPEYVLINHNTFVNIGRSLFAGNQHRNTYVTNNIFVNGYWQGADEDQYSDPEAVDRYAGFFTIESLPARFGTNATRRIVLANNSYYRDPRIDALVDENGTTLREQPLVNDTTQAYFSLFSVNNGGGMYIDNNYVNTNYQLMTTSGLDVVGDEAEPGLVSYDDIYTAEFLDELQNKASLNYQPTPAVVDRADMPYYDPGRLEEVPAEINWPLPEDFSYPTSATHYTAGTDGLPLGDLNWFPEQKETYLASRDQFVADIEALAGAVVVDTQVDAIEAEDESVVTYDGDAEIESVGGTFNLQGGQASWTFDLGNTGDVTVGLDAVVSLGGESARGVRLYIDDTQINTQSLYGETMFCAEGFVAYDGTTACAQLQGSPALPPNDFGTVSFNTSTVIAVDGQNPDGPAVLTLAPGPHTVRLESGWGGDVIIQQFDVTDESGDNVLTTLLATEAETQDVVLDCDEGVFCASGFRYVSLGSGGAVSVTVNAPSDGTYLLRPFVLVPGGGSATAMVSVDGTEQGTYTVSSASDAVSSSDFVTSEIELTAGSHTLTLSAPDGNLYVDSFSFLQRTRGPVATEGLPEGFALGNSYPNPTAGRATIEFSIGEVSNVRLDVYDVLGRRVATLADGPMPAGDHLVRLDVGGLSSGTYLYRLEAGEVMVTKRLTVVR